MMQVMAHEKVYTKSGNVKESRYTLNGVERAFFDDTMEANTKKIKPDRMVRITASTVNMSWRVSSSGAATDFSSAVDWGVRSS